LAAAWLCAKAMLNKKGDEVIILDLREAQSAPADFFVICTCESTVQSKAVASEVDNQWRSQGWQIGKSEGWDAGEWIILDYFDVVVHVFLREKRDYFKLEKLWSDGVFYSVKEDGTIHPIQRK
jgi:ribosome-associated protein